MAGADRANPLPKPVPGRLFRWVKIASWFELGLFTALLFFWIAPGYPSETALFGLLHGIGYLGLCGLILWAIVRREAPWPLLAATAHAAGTGRRGDRNRADRAPRLGNRGARVDTARRNGE